MASTTTTADGQRIQYVDHGGDGPAVLLLHSFLMDADMFAPQVAALGDTYRLVAMDFRGHGGTPADGPFDYWDVARDALAVLDELGIERAAAIGTSQGGFVAMRLALLAPDRIAAIAALGTSAAAEDPQVAAAYRALAEAWEAQGPIDPLLDTVATICLGTMDATDWKDRWRTYSGERLQTIMTALVSRDDILPRLAEISCPAVVLHGSADAAYPVVRAEEIAKGIPAADPLVIIQDGAHFLSLTHADAVNPHLRDFLAAQLH